MLARLARYYDMSNNPTIMYHVEGTDAEVPITDDVSFAAILEHAARSYSMFSLTISVRAPLIHSDSRKTVNFSSMWRVSKPKFPCIRAWLLSLQNSGKTLPAPDTLSYGKISCFINFIAHFSGEKAMLFSNLKNDDSSLVQSRVSHTQTGTNQEAPFYQLHQSSSSFVILSAQMLEEPNYPNLLSDSSSMLHEKMMLDPAISIVLFNEYIPLQRRDPKGSEAAKVEKLTQEVKSMFISTPAKPASSTSGLFIKSEPAPKNEMKETAPGSGVFLRSTSPSADEDWVIA